jgi:hypothetical protein
MGVEMKHTRLFSYVVNHDTGFAPNPFFGYCTLATCKPSIRRTANVGDWIAGLTSKSKGNKLIYAMRVSEIVTFIDYFGDDRFGVKKPDFSKGEVLHKCGDNIYEPLADGKFRQLQSMHSKNRTVHEDPGAKRHDLRGLNVLVSDNFSYLGKSAVELPDNLTDLIVGRGHKNKFSQETVATFEAFFSKLPSGVADAPSVWPGDDVSWSQK